LVKNFQRWIKACICRSGLSFFIIFLEHSDIQGTIREEFYKFFRAFASRPYTCMEEKEEKDAEEKFKILI